MNAAQTIAATTYDWTGASSTSWTPPGNWKVGGVVQTINYPGKSVTDIAQIGVTYTFATQPVLNAGTSPTIASLTFGTKSTATLTVNSGYILTVTGSITQNPSNSSYGTFTTTLAGTGAISCASVNVGDNSTFPPLLANNFLSLVSTIASLQVTGNVTVNSTSYGLLLSLGFNNAAFFHCREALLQ